MTAIFQPEIATLESQVAALQAQIAALEQRITLLNETELLAGGSLEALKGAIQKVTALAPDAIANLRAAVLNLFGGDNSNDNGGNQPISPAPQPDFDNRTLHQKTLDDCRAFASGEIREDEKPKDDRTLHQLALDACREYAQEQQANAPQPELTGQSCDFASLLASPLASPLSSWLCCQLEDVPSAALTGQSVEIACVVSDAPPIPEYIELVPLNHLVAYQRKTSTGEIICCYVGGNNKNRLKDWGSWLCTQHSVGSGFEVRKAVRLTAYNHELKIWGMSLKQIERLAETDTTKTPPSRYHVASMPVAEKLLAAEVEKPTPIVDQVDGEVEAVLNTEAKLEQEAQPDPQGFQVGSRVEIVSDRHGVELVGQSGIVTAGTVAGAAVNVGGIMRWFCSDELSAFKTETSEAEKVAIASIQPPAYNPYPIGRRGAAANFEAYQAAKAVEREKKLAVSTSDEEPDF